MTTRYSDYLELLAGPAPPPSPHGGTTRLYVAENGSVRLIESDGTDSEVGGGRGGSQPVSAQYSGGQVTIADGGGDFLTWDSLDAGTELLDRSNLGVPLVLADGLYAVTAKGIAFAPLTSGGFVAFVGSVNGSVVSASSAGTSEHPDIVGFSVTAIAQMLAGDNLLFTVFNHDGAAPVDVALSVAVVVKLT